MTVKVRSGIIICAPLLASVKCILRRFVHQSDDVNNIHQLKSSARKLLEIVLKVNLRFPPPTLSHSVYLNECVFSVLIVLSDCERWGGTR